jgi:hypothetical protein
MLNNATRIEVFNSRYRRSAIRTWVRDESKKLFPKIIFIKKFAGIFE